MGREPRVRAGALMGLVLCAAVALTGCTDGGGRAQPAPATAAVTSAPSTPTVTPEPGSPAPAPPVTTSSPPVASAPPAGPPPSRGPTRLDRWFDRELSGGDLRIGRERERTDSYRSYDVTYRSQELRISGVLNVPVGRGTFPAVVLAHGYIDPEVYVRGQGMPRERRHLADAGYIALHVDYRNHAQSDDDPDLARTFRLGYAVDILNAVNALRASDDVPVDDDRIALMGRSMGGGVVYKALEMAPGLVGAGVVFAAVSSDEADNYRQFSSPSPFWDYVEERWGTPEDNPDFWDAISADTYFDRITEPVLIHHGTVDTTCPPAWATHTERSMQRAGVTAILEWYPNEGHTFEAAFDEAMERTTRFLDSRLDR